MPQSFFIWNGADCRSKGIILRGPVPIVRPEERVKHTEIPGRSGDLTELEGENIYNSYIQTATISVRGGFRVREVYKWLRGSGYVTFSGEPDKKQPARIIGAITLERISRNLDHWAGEVQFYCQPLKEKITAENPTVITSSSTNIYNSGDVNSKPMILMTASASLAMVSMGGQTLAINGLTSGAKYWIDSDSQMLLDFDRTTDCTSLTTGDFPILTPGTNVVMGLGWSRLEIEKRERFL